MSTPSVSLKSESVKLSNPQREVLNRFGTLRDEGIEIELSKQGLRRAEQYESGWYVYTSYGTVWATDLPAPAPTPAAPQPEPSAAEAGAERKSANVTRIGKVHSDIIGLLDELYAKRVITDEQMDAALGKADDILDILMGKSSSDTEAK